MTTHKHTCLMNIPVFFSLMREFLYNYLATVQLLLSDVFIEKKAKVIIGNSLDLTNFKYA